MVFCPTGTSVVISTTTNPQTVSLTGLNQDCDVIRIASEPSTAAISFGNGYVLLSRGTDEFFKVPSGVTSIDVVGFAGAGPKVSVTIGTII